METNKREFSSQQIQQLKEDLKDLRRYLEEFLVFLPLPVCSVSPLGIIVDANRTFYSLTGYKKEERIRGETVFRVETLFEGKKKWGDLEERILDKGIIKGKEMILITKDKKQIPVSLSASYKEDEKGNLIGYFLAFTDITDFKMLQENLEEKVKERTKELQKRVRELEKFHELTVGRELKMIELKKEIKNLKEELNKKVEKTISK